MATVAFGTGLDSPNVRTTIHWDPPEDLEMYIQETGHGCDNMLSNAILYYNKRDIAANSHASEEVKRYRDEALDLPLHRHLCCDVCASVCPCEDCDFNVNSPGSADNSTYAPPVPSNTGASNAPETIQATLREQLTTYRKQLSKKFAYTTALVGIELCTGLTDRTITNIAANC